VVRAADLRQPRRIRTVPRLAFEDRGRGPSNVAAPCWCAELVVDDPQLFSLRSQAQDGQQKISATRGVDPSSAEYQVRQTESRMACSPASFVLP
jgi:hypothetical protein